jgi:AraC-like DNA-binding protein
VSGLLSNQRFGRSLAQLVDRANTDGRSAGLRRRRAARRQAQRRLARPEIEALVDQYRGGTQELQELAAEFGVHRTTVAAHLDRAGVTVRRKALTAAQIDEATRLYESGWSLARIGRHLGVYPTSVYYRLRQAGVRLRPRPGRS